MLDVQMAAHAEQLRQLQLEKQAEAAKIAADLELHRAELAKAAERQKEKARMTQQLMTQQVGGCRMWTMCEVAVAIGQEYGKGKSAGIRQEAAERAGGFT